MVAAAVIGGVGALGAAGINAYSSNKASQQQAAAQQAAINEQQQMFQTVQGDLAPFMTAGSTAIPSLNTLLSTLTGYTSPTGAPMTAIGNLAGLNGPQNMTAALEQTPGYQFTQTMGQKAVNNSLAAKGLAGPGGPLATASADYATGLASNTWQQVLQSMLSAYGAGVNGLTSTINPVANLVTTGANAAGGLATNATQTGGNIAGNISNIGNAQAAGTLGIGSAASGGINSLASYGSLAALLNSDSGGGLYSGPAYGGGTVLSDAYGGSSANPLAGLTANDYGPGFKRGGRPPVGRPILVGERGPELIVMDRPGTVIPNNVLHQLLHRDPRRRSYQGLHKLLRKLEASHAR